MRVVQAAPATRWQMPARPLTTSRTPRIERLALLVTTVVACLGLWLVYSEQLRTSASCTGIDTSIGTGSDTSSNTVTGTTPATARRSQASCVNLTTVTQASELAPLLTTFPEAAERTAVARAILTRIADANAEPLTRVGQLASIRIPASQVRARPAYVRLNERLRERPTLTDVPALSGADIAALKPNVIVRTQDDYTSQMTVVALLFFVPFWVAHIVRWWFGTTGDGVLLAAVQLLTSLGLMTMIALRDPLRDTVIAQSFAEGVAAGTVLWILVSFVDFEQQMLRRSVLVPLGAAVALAVALLVAGSGPGGSGVKVNLFGLQPVEAIRLLVVFALAAYFARRWQFLREFSEGVGPSATVRRHVQLPRWKDVRPLGITLATLLVFFFLQKDLGPALVLSCVFLGLYGYARNRIALVLCGFAVLGVGFGIGYLLGVPDTVAQRVAMWVDPWENALSGGDQIAHALWAMASGGPLGLGAGAGDAQLIPAGHTDLVLAAVGEDLGYVGVASALALIGLLAWRMLSVSLRSPGDYTAFLAAGLTLALVAQAAVIVGGMLGLLPLAGVVTPFMSFGRSSMLSNFAAVAICAAIARRQGTLRMPFVVPVRALKWTCAGVVLMLIGRAGLVQVVRADAVAGRANLTRQADGGHRYQYNPRLIALARAIPRGTIFDRHGLPLATSDRDLMTTSVGQYRELGVIVECPGRDGRCYPLGGAAFHLLGDVQRQLNWAARNTSFAEQQFDVHLRGFDDHARTVALKHPQTGETYYAVKRDYRELVPLIRHRDNPSHPDVRRILDSDRDLQLTIDAGLQILTARAVRRQAMASGSGRAAAVVVDPATGDLLASASYPWPEPKELRGEVTTDPLHLLDRARYGLYPPGSTFKLITAAAALRSDHAQSAPTYECTRLPDGRVGGRVPGAGRPIRDDLMDKTPHGKLDMHKALVVSCNAYFANLAQRLGSKALAETAALAQISVAPAPAETNLRRSLPFAGYGQGDVVATPLRMARVVAAIASDGSLREVVVSRDMTSEGSTSKPDPRSQNPDPTTTWLEPIDAASLRRDMREVVTAGTGRSLATHPVPIAGKTGTAEVDDKKSHSWFVGFAPYGNVPGSRPPRIAFAVIVENAGYGGRIAAPLAGEIVSAAEARGLLK